MGLDDAGRVRRHVHHGDLTVGRPEHVSGRAGVRDSCQVEEPLSRLGFVVAYVFVRLGRKYYRTSPGIVS